jgi:hypothetical protein
MERGEITIIMAAGVEPLIVAHTACSDDGRPARTHSM